MIDIGSKMRFVPHWYKGECDTPEETRRKQTTGKVIYVDREHRKFTVKYSICGGPQMKETFKFSQIGSDIHVVRGDRYGR